MKTTIRKVTEYYFGPKLYNSIPIDIETEDKYSNFQKQNMYQDQGHRKRFHKKQAEKNE